jgi:hypothetical protein
MAMKNTMLRLSLFALLTVVATVPALAGSAVIGSVAGSMNATIGGQSLLPKTTIFSGDSLQVKDGVAVIAVGNNNRVIFGRDTVASFLRESNEITVLLSQGDVSMVHPTDGTPVRVKAGEISVTPAAGFKTLGQVAMLNGSLVITAKEGALQVDGQGETKNVSKGQTIVISPKTADNKGGGSSWGGGSSAIEIATLGAAGVGAVLAGVAMSRAGNANTAANEAIAASNAATSAANTANSTAAAAAASAAAAATSAANAQLLSECIYDVSQGTPFASPYILTPAQCASVGSTSSTSGTQ